MRVFCKLCEAKCWWLLLMSVMVNLQPVQGQRLLFYAPFEGDCKPAVAGGGEEPEGAEKARFAPGKLGQGVVADADLKLSYPIAGNLDKHRGTVCMWVQPLWSGDDGKNHWFLADDIDFNKIEENNIAFWKWSVGTLRFDQRKDPSTYVTAGVLDWKAGHWYHIAASWDVQQGASLFINGERVASRDFYWVVKPGRRLRIGTDWSGGGPAECVIDELRIYDRPLTAAQLRAVMEGQELVSLHYETITAPQRVMVGKPFGVRVRVRATRETKWNRPIAISLDGIELTRTTPPPVLLPAGKSVELGPFTATIPEFYYVSPGKHLLTAELFGSLLADGKTASAAVTVLPPPRRRPSVWEITRTGRIMRDGKPFPAEGEGLWFEGNFYTGADSKAIARLIQSGRSIDALPARLVDEVDCTRTDHGFEEFGSSRVVELLPGKRFRITGPPDTVTQTRQVYGRSVKLLPAFSYRLRVSPRPTPHLLVVESVDDAERYLEVAVDVAPGSITSPPLRSTAIGSTELINLGVAYTGREQRVSGEVFREYFLFFPKSDSIIVTVSHSGRELVKPKEAGAAVSHIWVYELTEPLGQLANPISLPKEQQRSVSLFYPQCTIMYEEYGFSAATPATRQASIRVLSDYLRFIGFDRLEFHPYAFSTQAYFRSRLFEPAGRFDIFEDVLPVCREAGIQVVPRVDSLVFFDKLWEKDEQNYQHRLDGTIHNYFGKVPDPLRPQVQQVLLDVLREMLDTCKDFPNVVGVGFRANGKFGSLYVGSSAEAPPQETGYTQWDLEEFEKDTHIRVEADKTNPRLCYDFIRRNCWKEWIDWRCRRIHDWWCRARDLANSYGRLLFVQTVIPYDHHFPSEQTQWWGRGIDPLEQHRYHGYDPALYTGEKGMIISRAISLGADRYFGRSHNDPYWHDPRVPGLYRTAEGAAVELYYIYWELSDHPRGFRVGPEWAVGRGWMEPLTHAMRTMNVRNVVFYNWHRATIGREIGLREFCRAFRALPAVAPRDFEGKISPPADEKLWVRWFGDRLCVVNDSPESRTIQLTFPSSVRPLSTITDLATNSRFAIDSQRRLQLHLRAFDFRTLVFQR